MSLHRLSLSLSLSHTHTHTHFFQFLKKLILLMISSEGRILEENKVEVFFSSDKLLILEILVIS